MNIPFDLTITASLLLSIIAMFVAWFRGRRKDVDDQLEDIGKRLTGGARRMDGHDARLDQLQTRVEALPNTEDVHKLELQMVAMNGNLEVMAARLQANHSMLTRVDNILSRHEDHLRGDNG